MKKNDVFKVMIEDLSETGEGIGKQDGYIWFIKDTVIGDYVEAKVMKMKKNYGFAKLVNILQASEKRIEPECKVAAKCGGCQLQLMSYEDQLAFKERKAFHNIMRIGKFSKDEIPMLPIIGMEDTENKGNGHWRYRNKAQFPFGYNKEGEVITGFYAGRTHSIISNDDCLLGVKENKIILEKVKEYMKNTAVSAYDEEAHKGLVRHVLIRKAFVTGELMVCVIINGNKLPKQEQLVESLLKIPGMTSISLNINKEKTNVILGRELIHLYGPGYITDFIGNVKYQISPLSFYQVNPIQTTKLYNTALEYAGLTGGETVWDLYCGIGTISLFLAQKAGKVYGVEIVPEAIEDARNNAAINDIQNVEFFVGKAEEVLPEQYKKTGIKADVIVVDPPRKGCDQVCLDTIIQMEPKKVVYVSCDSATLARDLRILCDQGFKLEKVRCCDMFPGTVHVETVVLMSKVK